MLNKFLFWAATYVFLEIYHFIETRNCLLCHIQLLRKLLSVESFSVNLFYEIHNLFVSWALEYFECFWYYQKYIFLCQLIMVFRLFFAAKLNLYSLEQKCNKIQIFSICCGYLMQNRVSQPGPAGHLWLTGAFKMAH